MDFVIAIPSYKRAETLKKKTLRVLQEQNIDKEKIFIFVANQEEYDIYVKTLPEYYNKIIIGQVGMANIRNVITNYFDEDKYIFSMDDDINYFVKLTKEKTKETKQESEKFSPGDLEKFIIDGFRECEKKNFNLFGIYPVDNSYFMKDRITYDLRYIIGSCWGCINKKILITQQYKEDFERTIKYYIQDKGVIRFENISLSSCYYKEPGGMQVERTKALELEGCYKLVEKYPNLCSLNLKKKSGFAEVRLKDKNKKKISDI